MLVKRTFFSVSAYSQKFSKVKRASPYTRGVFLGHMCLCVHITGPIKHFSLAGFGLFFLFVCKRISRISVSFLPSAVPVYSLCLCFLFLFILLSSPKGLSVSKLLECFRVFIWSDLMSSRPVAVGSVVAE